MNVRCICTGIRLALAILSIVVVSACTSGSSTAMSSEQAFWDALKITGAEAESYVSLKDMAAQADAVVVGMFTSFDKSRQIQGDAAEDIVTYAAATLVVDEAVRGTVPDKQLPVEFLVNAPVDAVDAAITDMAAQLPKGKLLLFLREKGPDEEGLYRLVNSTGLWTEVSSGGVNAPLAEIVMPELEEQPDAAEQERMREEAAPYAKELSNVKSLEDLIAYVRNGQR